MNNFKTMMDEMKIRGYSRQSIGSYCYINQKFLDFIKKSPREVSKTDIEAYLVRLFDKGKSSATRHLVCSALKFYYEAVLKRRFHLKHPKKSSILEPVLSREEILKMIGALENPKHRLLIELMYGSGLRLGEAIKARVENFDIENRVFIVKMGKGGKDRFVNLSEQFIRNFAAYTRGMTSGYLFESSHRTGMYISGRTAEEVVKNALKKAGIAKRAHPHTLRASFATHLIENGIDISYVQKLLGHSRVNTTQRYIRLSPKSIQNIKSPLDN